jgi:hypothetical protein
MSVCSSSQRGHVLALNNLRRVVLQYGVQRDVFSCASCSVVGPHWGDAWGYSWDDGLLNFLNPPFHLLQRVVDTLITHTRFVLLAPLWSSATWFARLKKLSVSILPIPKKVQVTQLGIMRDWQLALYFSGVA